MSGRSSVTIYGENLSQCGYCTTSKAEKAAAPETSCSFGIVSAAMSVYDYEAMMLHGWRRSGTYFYKPVMHRTCCPAYTIRLRVASFSPSRSQKQVVRRVERFLATGDIHAKEERPDIGSVHDTKAAANKERVESSSSSPSAPSSSSLLPASSSPVSSLPSLSSSANELPPQVSEPLVIEMDDANYTDEKFSLYKKYQLRVHHDIEEDVTPKSFSRFLCESPLIRTAPVAPVGSGTSLPVEKPLLKYEYGSYHQLYRLNGRLIAVGVVDLLPSGLSSVYLFYDPDDRQLVLGKYTALREISFCQSQGLEYYYMGFYIHSCQKMRYKAEYKPSELLCPTTLTWHILDDCVKFLDAHRFTPLESTLAEERAALSGEESQDLSRYKPRFPVLVTDSLMATVALDVGAPRAIFISQLRPEGIRIVKRILRDFNEACDGEVMSRMLLKLS
jgi:arginyl-tRNA---protein transferase